MKILFATTYIYKKEWPEFTRNRTGFGIMVEDIFEGISQENDTYLFSHVVTKGHNNVLKHTWGDIFKNAKIRDWVRGIRYFFVYEQNLKGRVHYFYYGINAGAFRKAIKDIKPDVVYIHGISIAVKTFIDVCKEENVSYVVTLHGLIGLDKTILAAKWDKNLEKDFLIEADQKNIPVTVISSGMKKRIEANYLHHISSNIAVICNGTKIPFKEEILNMDGLDIRKAYGLKAEEKIIVVVGSICERKNQVQIISALVTGKVTEPYQMFFCGADTTNGQFEAAIQTAGLQKIVHFLGFFPHQSVKLLLQQADLNIVASKDEGFGLSIIEAFSYGVPTVTFADLDSVPALFDASAMVLVPDRDDISLAKGINEGLKKSWSRTWIEGYSKHFSIDKIISNYIGEYRQTLIREGGTATAKTYDFVAAKKACGYKILTYIGNITDNKNQIELVELMAQLKDEKIVAILAGREVDEGRVRKYIIENKLEEQVVLAGFCTEMGSIWEYADLNIFFSKNDGFGLSVIEGFMHGVPSIMMDDLDATEDVTIGYGIQLVSRKDRNLLNDVLNMTSIEWNRKKIMREAELFSKEHMIQGYLHVLKKFESTEN